jgi:hypothetical protein
MTLVEQLRDAAADQATGAADWPTALTDAADELDAARHWLWLTHGCPVGVLYGDDGQRQCNNAAGHPTARFLDFNADPLGRLLEAATAAHNRAREAHDDLRDVLAGCLMRGEVDGADLRALTAAVEALGAALGVPRARA